MTVSWPPTEEHPPWSLSKSRLEDPLELAPEGWGGPGEGPGWTAVVASHCGDSQPDANAVGTRRKGWATQLRDMPSDFG